MVAGGCGRQCVSMNGGGCDFLLFRRVQYESLAARTGYLGC